MKRVLAVAGTLAIALTLSACGGATGPVGTWGSGFKADHEPYLLISTATQGQGDMQVGYVSGSDGCSKFNGQWQGNASDIQIKLNPQTQLTCDDVKGWAELPAVGKVEGNKLTLTDANGAVVTTLDRNPN